ncbi:chorismate mutase [Gallaecimonas sp. GXIMD4217]|uniref:chorismate mutase n=1 Tax=Gallaecimonas sp. GXIMD4217 TaxID=3131927 RepID=UPI00311ABBF4
MAESLDELRGRIDALDQQLLALIKARRQLARTIGTLKSGAIFAPEREYQLVEARIDEEPELPADFVRRLCRDLISLCRGSQGRFQVAIQAGQEGLLHALLGQATGAHCCADPLEALAAGQAQAALLAGNLPEELQGMQPVALARQGDDYLYLLTPQGARAGSHIIGRGPKPAEAENLGNGYWLEAAGHGKDEGSRPDGHPYWPLSLWPLSL